MCECLVGQESQAMVDETYRKALRRLQELRNEINELETFIHLYRKISSTKSVQAELDWPGSLGAGPMIKVEPAPEIVTVLEQEGFPQESRTRRRRGTPSEIARIAERVLLDEKRPLNRRQLVDALEARNVEIPSEDKARYLGTVLWRNQEVFEHIEGRGYWVKGAEIADG